MALWRVPDHVPGLNRPLFRAACVTHTATVCFAAPCPHLPGPTPAWPHTACIPFLLSPCTPMLSGSMQATCSHPPCLAHQQSSVILSAPLLPYLPACLSRARPFTPASAPGPPCTWLHTPRTSTGRRPIHVHGVSGLVGAGGHGPAVRAGIKLRHSGTQRLLQMAG